MASTTPHIDKEKIKEKLDVSHFDFNAVIRGMQLTLVGGTYLLLSKSTLYGLILMIAYANSTQSLAESGSLHIKTLSTSSYRRGWRDSDPPRDILSGS